MTTTAAKPASQKTVTYKNLKLKVPAKLPFATLIFLKENMSGADTIGALGSIVGDEQLEKVLAAGFDIDQGSELLDKVLDATGGIKA